MGKQKSGKRKGHPEASELTASPGDLGPRYAALSDLEEASKGFGGPYVASRKGCFIHRGPLRIPGPWSLAWPCVGRPPGEGRGHAKLLGNQDGVGKAKGKDKIQLPPRAPPGRGTKWIQKTRIFHILLVVSTPSLYLRNDASGRTLKTPGMLGTDKKEGKGLGEIG